MAQKGEWVRVRADPHTRPMSLRGEIHSNLPRWRRVADTLTLGAVSRARAEEITEARLVESDWQSRYDEALFDLHSALQERAVALGAPRPKLDLSQLFEAELSGLERPPESAERDAFLAYMTEFRRQAAQAVVAVKARALAVARGEYDAQVKAGAALDDVLPDIERPTLSDFSASPSRPQAEHERGPSLSSL